MLDIDIQLVEVGDSHWDTTREAPHEAMETLRVEAKHLAHTLKVWTELASKGQLFEGDDLVSMCHRVQQSRCRLRLAAKYFNTQQEEDAS